MKSYCYRYKKEENAEAFIKEYADWIENPRQGKCPYSDPDEVTKNNVKNPQFYTDITSFLNIQYEKYKDRLVLEGTKNKWTFISPTGNPEDELGNRTITLKNDKENNYLNLTSDQFGFSAIKEDLSWSPIKYPYAMYEHCYKGDKRRIALYIWMTRTIGGSFLWPKVKNNRSLKSEYNENRGVRSYIEDRVDLTLYEIKEFYDEYYDKKTDFEKIKEELSKKGSKLLMSQDAKDIYKWLSIFHDFNTYIDFFCFGSFVHKEKNVYYPKNIFTGESIKNINNYRNGNFKSDKYEGYKFIQNKAQKEDLEKAFLNLAIWTSARSKRIEKIIASKD